MTDSVTDAFNRASAITGVKLTRSEALIFDVLHRSCGSWVSSEGLGEQAVGWPNSGVKTFVCHLRKKVAPQWLIENRSGVGYRLKAVA